MVFEILDKVDKTLSGYIHNARTTLMAEMTIMPFAVMFNPPGYVPITLCMCLYLVFQETKLTGKDEKEITTQH